ncbi:hypothetical protein [Pseudomonas sp. AA-38]|uniref:hypothetical protein n=1 Tax=Pseudomonas sp. AA-38 TaxID=3028807 RepID=UPI0023F9434C|nr:hypothetical protein [Pseudomonas sp. AA-38]
MHIPSLKITISLAVLMACAACSSTPERTTAGAVTDGWLGRWNGPEGTYLEITGTPDDYRLTIANLDGPRRFVGRAQGAKIVFVRDGVVESLTASDGEATGMKWLLDKHNCLTVRSGEGYCRD